MAGTVHSGGVAVDEAVSAAVLDGARAEIELEERREREIVVPIDEATEPRLDEVRTASDGDDVLPLLWHSNAPWAATGYGQQTRLFAGAVAALGHRTAISAFWGLLGAKLAAGSPQGETLEVYPGGRDPYGNDTLTAHAATHFRGDLRTGIIFTLVDVWILNPQQLHKDRANVACWTPVDHRPVPPKVLGFFQASGATPIAMSRFGQRQLEAHGLEPLYMPHGIDTQGVFAPEFGLDGQAGFREKLGLPLDRPVISCVAANKDMPSRKCLPELLEGFRLLLDQWEQKKGKRPYGRPVLYLHTETQGAHNGVNVQQLVNQLGLADDVAFPEQYAYFTGQLTPEYVADVWRASDLAVNVAAGEGFGIPIVEAQACGTPVVTCANTAQEELAGNEDLLLARNEQTPTYTYQASWQFRPKPPAVARVLTHGLKMVTGDKRDRYRRAARKMAERYDYRRVAEEYLEPVMRSLQAKFTSPAVEAEIWTPGPDWDPRKGPAAAEGA